MESLFEKYIIKAFLMSSQQAIQIVDTASYFGDTARYKSVKEAITQEWDKQKEPKYPTLFVFEEKVGKEYLGYGNYNHKNGILYRRFIPRKKKR